MWISGRGPERMLNKWIDKGIKRYLEPRYWQIWFNKKFWGIWRNDKVIVIECVLSGDSLRGQIVGTHRHRLDKSSITKWHCLPTWHKRGKTERTLYPGQRNSQRSERVNLYQTVGGDRQETWRTGVSQTRLSQSQCHSHSGDSLHHGPTPPTCRC